MALDEPQANDELFDEKGIKFIIEKDLFDRAKPISVDFVQSAMGAGFMIKSELTKSEGCGSGGSCSC
jgi:iron-sulfur cluster assembly protein